jgi:hypothetical protein
MLKAIIFNDPEKFDFNNDNNNMDIISNNCIILCEDTKIKYFLARQIEDICDGKHRHEEGYLYSVGDDENAPDPQITNRIEYLPTALFTIDNEQRIALTVEASFILTATSIEDIWFAERTADNKISIYPFRVFKGHKETWDKGIEKVYRDVINGRYMNYKYAFVYDEDDKMKS